MARAQGAGFSAWSMTLTTRCRSCSHGAAKKRGHQDGLGQDRDSNVRVPELPGHTGPQAGPRVSPRTPRVLTQRPPGHTQGGDTGRVIRWLGWRGEEGPGMTEAGRGAGWPWGPRPSARAPLEDEEPGCGPSPGQRFSRGRFCPFGDTGRLV